MLGGLSPRSALLDVGIGVVALALSVIFGRHAALSQPGTRLLDALGYALVVVSCAELAEQTRETEADRRAYQERLRIARDLHDVIGHSFAAVNVQARVATTVLETDRAQARRALTAIESISREALKEIRQAPGVSLVSACRMRDAPRETMHSVRRSAGAADPCSLNSLMAATGLSWEGARPCRVR